MFNFFVPFQNEKKNTWKMHWERTISGGDTCGKQHKIQQHYQTSSFIVHLYLLMLLFIVVKKKCFLFFIFTSFLILSQTGRWSEAAVLSMSNQLISFVKSELFYKIFIFYFFCCCSYTNSTLYIYIIFFLSLSTYK